MAGLLDYASGIIDQAGSNVKGLLSDPMQTASNIIDQLTQRAAAQQAATKAAWATRDPKVMAQNALDSSQTALGFAPLGITAWHGSPHKFNKFDSSKIGTGEGAQAYGHGLYLAENQAVAKDYAKMQPAVTPSPNRVRNGVELVPGSPEYHAATLLERSTLPATKKDVAGWIKDAESWPDIRKNNPSEQSVLAGWQKTLEVLNSVKKKTEFKVGKNENLYKTDIPDEAVARFLDWDKPLSQQSKEVQAGLSKALAKRPGMTGAELYNVFGGSGALRQDLNTNFGFGKQASETLKELGIPGIRYLDGGSRGAGQGSSNFVVFDPEMIRILERNGQSTGAAPWQPGEWRGLLGNN